MKVHPLQALCVLPLVVSLSPGVRAQSEFRDVIAPALVATLPPGVQVLPAPRDDLSALVEQLLEVDSSETFYAGSFRFTEFPPLDKAPLAPYPLSGKAKPGDASFRALIRLVELGPRALPILLQHLDDDRQTKTIVPDELAKSLGPSAFVPFRPGSRREESAIRNAGLPEDNPGPDFDATVEDYTLTVGDMCFVLIGMITNRSYYVVVDEFDAQLNSPTRSEQMVTAVRGKWGPQPEAVELYEQLKMDLEIGGRLYSDSAAIRLLYYFPGHSDNLVIAQLGKLINEHQPGNENLADFLQAISWSSDPRIMSTLRRFLRTASDATQIAAAARVYGTIPDPRGHEQLLELADKLKPRRDPGHVEASRSILKLNLLTFPDRKEETLRRFLEGAGAYAQTSACVVSEEIDRAPVGTLAPLLAVESASTGDRYLIKGEGAERWPEADDYLPYRICDRAYETISRHLGDKETQATGTYAEMDTKIEALNRRLARRPASRPFTKSEIAARQRAQNRHRRDN